MMNSPKFGIRFDGERPNIGYNGTVIGNVAMMTNGVNLKGDYHKAINNFVVDSHSHNGHEVKLYFSHCSLTINSWLFCVFFGLFLNCYTSPFDIKIEL